MSSNLNQFPLRFSELLGQTKAKKMLAAAILSGRLPHAFLFRGPDGIGKRLFARSLAASINCRSRKGADGCGVCPSCRKYSSGNHPDFKVISPEKNTIRINTIREMNRSLAYPPYESFQRVILLEDIHVMRQEAANSLLKTLEEPPEDNLFILTAELSKEVLPTIISRCQVVPFFSLSSTESCRILQMHDPELGEKRAFLFSRLAEGSPGKALSFRQTEMIDILEKVVAVLHDPAYHSDDRIGGVLQVAASMADLNEHLPAFFGLLRIWIRDLILVSTSQQKRIDLEFMEAMVRREWGEIIPVDRLFDKLSIIDQAQRELNRNCNKTFVCEVLLFKLQKGLTGEK